jgi:protein-tyrosine phosphatase
VIDTHCHLLPGLDDGPATESDAVELARCLAADDISTVVCTPHYSAQFPTSHADAGERLAALRSELVDAGIEVEAALAAEVSPGYAVSTPLEELVERSIAGRFAVVEVLSDTPPAFFATVQDRLAEADVAVIFAHPERCRALRRRPNLVDAIRRRGALLQVVAPSLLGRWGNDVATAAWRLIDTGRADLLASDAHGARRRSVALGEAAALVRARLGNAVARELTERRPASVLAGLVPATL